MLSSTRIILIVAWSAMALGAAADQRLQHAVAEACAAPYPADRAIDAILEAGWDAHEVWSSVAQVALSEVPPALDSDTAGNVLRSLRSVGDPQDRIRDEALVGWVLRAAAPGRRFRGEALGVLGQRADPSFDTLIGRHASRWLTAPGVEPRTVYGTMKFLLGRPYPISPGAMDVIGRVAFDPEYGATVAGASFTTQGFPETADDRERLRRDQKDVRGAAMYIRLRHGLADQDFPRYMGLDVVGRAAAGHVLLGTLSGEYPVWTDDAGRRRAIARARDLFMDPATHDLLEASPVGLWMFCVRRDDITVETRRAMLQAMLDNAATTQNPEIIGFTKQFILDAGFDPSEFTARP